MREEYNSVLSTPTEADTGVSVKSKYGPIYRPGRYVGWSLLLIEQKCYWSQVPSFHDLRLFRHKQAVYIYIFCCTQSFFVTNKQYIYIYILLHTELHCNICQEYQEIILPRDNYIHDLYIYESYLWLHKMTCWTLEQYENFNFQPQEYSEVIDLCWSVMN